jgi:Ser/Thr protein kinase RdoA (MazF antagonist)
MSDTDIADIEELEIRRQALGHYVKDPAGFSIEPLGDGLINETFLVEGPVGALPPSHGTAADRAVLQRVNPIFGLAVHEDIEAVSRHLVKKGLLSPLLYRTQSGALAVDLGKDGVWRLSSYVPGRTTSRVEPALCGEAGRLVGAFHAALFDLDHDFRFRRPGAHDLSAHLRTLQEAQAAPSPPPGFAALADEILHRAAALPAQVKGPLRVCHGDLKINNLRFGDDGNGLCLLDLDTLCRQPLCIEMGDALRSWCNPSPLGENDPHGTFDLDLFARCIEGYAGPAAAFLTAEEQAGLVAGVERIALELAARFCADAVNRRYFRWDPSRFESQSSHNMVRAAGQLGVARGVSSHRAAAEALVERALHRATG